MSHFWDRAKSWRQKIRQLQTTAMFGFHGPDVDLITHSHQRPFKCMSKCREIKHARVMKSPQSYLLGRMCVQVMKHPAGHYGNQPPHHSRRIHHGVDARRPSPAEIQPIFHSVHDLWFILAAFPA